MPNGGDLGTSAKALVPALTELYRDLHRNPELSFQEHRTAGIVADRLEALGLEVGRGVGRTGVVGVLRNGAGPTVALRADMDALPVEEKTGLPYASTARGVDDAGVETPVAHACGHDMHVTCLLGAVEVLAKARAAWRGTVLALFQPAEEFVAGARAMVDDGVYDRFGTPSVVLGQHVAPFPAGTLGLHPGPSFAATDALRITLYGKGGHGSRPEAAVDPVVMAASAVVRLQTIVSRTVPATDIVVLTVGSIRAGTKENIIPDQAELMLSLRTFDETVRASALEAIRRIVTAEADASAAPRPPEITTIHSAPAVVNDPAAAERTRTAFVGEFGAEAIIEPGPVTGSEDVGVLATAAGAPCCFWLLGSVDPQRYAAAVETGTVNQDIPPNHSPHFAPVTDPTIVTGVTALARSAVTWLGRPE